MLALVLSTSIASTFTVYTKPNGRAPAIEAITDRGPILEMIVRCPKGTAIITYSKVEKLFCGPKSNCSADRGEIIGRTCK